MAYEVPDLPYDYNALEPHIDEATMRVHHDKHHQAYVDKANAALEGTEWADKDVNEVLQNLDQLPADKQGPVRNTGGGHYNHSLFWESMSPDGGGEPEGDLADRIEEDFGSYEGWKGEFEAAAGAAGGWALLVYDPVAKQLRNVAVDKHDQGALWGSHPILALDVWEHSYYYDYGPDRGEFIDAFFEVVNWDSAADEYQTCLDHFE